MNNLPTLTSSPTQPGAMTAPQGGPLLGFGPLGQLSEESKLELLEYWRSINRHRMAILALGLAVALVAAVVAFALRPVYRSTATVLVESGKPKIVSIEEVYGAIGGGQGREHFQTQVELLKSREVAMRTVLATKLWNEPEFDPRQNETGLGTRLKRLITFERADDRDWSDEKVLAEATITAFREALTVEPVRLSQLVKVSFESGNPRLAAQVANSTATAYIAGDREARRELTRNVNSDLVERAEELRTKLDESEAALQKYRDEKGIVNLNGSAQASVALQVTEFTQRLAEARVHRTQLESAHLQIKAVRNADYSSVPAVVANGSVSEARSKVAEAQSKVHELSMQFGANHPKMIDARAVLSEARWNLQRQVQSVIAGLKNEYEAALDTERSLEKALRSASGSIRDVNREEFQLGVLEREVQANKQLYEVFMGRAKETDAGSDLQAPVARIADSATPSKTPVKPKKAQIILISLVLGLLAGALGALLLDRLDTTLKGTDDAEQHLHQPVLTALPLLPDREQTNLARLFIDDPQSIHSEAVRTARTGVLLSNLDLAHKVLLVTSSVPGEGKTTVSTNLALAHAQTKRTILLDADMRRPQVGQRMGLPPNAKGLSNLVADTATVDECLHRIPGSTLLLMPAGNVPPNPLELLLSQRFRDVLKSLADMADIVVIDSPPVELVSDALVLAPLTTGAIYVVKAMDTPYPLARKGINRLVRGGARVLGVVLNQLDFQKAHQYYGEVTAQYGYGQYGYGYGVKPGAAAQADAGAAKAA